MKKNLLLFGALAIYAGLFSQQNPSPTGKLVDIGGYRLHIDTRGKGTPTVVLIAGSQAFSLDWALIVAEISKFTQVCSYDRPSLGWSDPGPEPRTFDQDVYELHTLLQRAGIKPPYVMVGHSLGGIIARFYEKKYPQEVKGMVLIDATSEDGTLFINNKIVRLRDLSQHRDIPGIKDRPDSLTRVPPIKDLEEIWKMTGQPKVDPPFDRLPIKYQQARIWALSQPKILLADNGNYWAEEFEKLFADSTYSMGSKPLYVVTSGMNVFAEKADSSMKAIWMEKLEQKEKMSVLSSNSKHIITTKSGHEIHLEEPELVISAIKWVVTAVRNKL